MNFRIKDLLITVLPQNRAMDCDPSCDMGTHPECTMGTKKDYNMDGAIDPAELLEMQIALRQVIARIDVALYNRQQFPETIKDRELLESKLNEAITELKRKQ